MKDFIKNAEKLAKKNGDYVYLFQIASAEWKDKCTKDQAKAIREKTYMQSPPSNGTMKSEAIKIGDLKKILSEKTKKKKGKKKEAKKEAAKVENAKVEDSKDTKDGGKKEKISE